MAKAVRRLTRWSGRHRSIAVMAWSAVAVAALLALLVVALGPLSWQIAGGSVRRLHGKDRADALNAVRQTVITAIGGAAALVALGFTVRTYYLSRRGQVTDRFGKAITQLASGRLEERLGGIHALEHVMAESPRDHDAVVGVLSAFVRTRTLLSPSKRARFSPISLLRRDRNSPPPHPELPADVDAAMIVLARRPKRDEPNRPDLRRTSLAGLSLRIYDFAFPPRLTGMFLTVADLRGADLRGADLRGTIAAEADLRWAFLQQADLSHTCLSRADLRWALMAKANLTGALLDGADLRDALGLTAEQLSRAMIDQRTGLSPDLATDPWVKARLADCLSLEGTDPWACPPPTPAPPGADRA
jgi:uncharacterized protein YjbI with pentapeptide repeats